MKLKISYPNDYQSAERLAAALAECGDEEGMLDAMAVAAKDVGGKFISGTDYGAIWECPARPQIPSWAAMEEIDEEE